jgi:hypothetical protein
VFPRADRPIAVEFPGYPVVRLRPILLELAGRGGSVPPSKGGTPPTPPHWWSEKGPPHGPPSDFKKFHFEGYVPRVGPAQTTRILVGTRRIEAYRAGMDQHPDTWTSEGVKGGYAAFTERSRG